MLDISGVSRTRENFIALSALRLGGNDLPKAKSGPASIEELKDEYLKICKDLGVAVDPDNFKSQGNSISVADYTTQ